MTQSRTETVRSEPSKVASTIPVSALTFAIARGAPISELETVTGAPVAELLAADGHVADDLPPRIMKSLFLSGLSSAPALEMAMRTPYSFFGGMERAAAYAPTGRAALEVFRDFAPTLAERTRAWSEESERFFSISFTHPLDSFDDGLTHETHMTLVWRFLRQMLGPEAQLEEAHCGFSAHGTHADYERTFGAPTYFGREPGVHKLVFRKDALAAANPAHNQVLYEAGRIYLQELGAAQLRETVREDFAALLGAVSACADRGEYRVERVAQAAATSLRTAQRVAAVNRTSLRRLIDEARLSRAKIAILADRRAPFAAIAERLGFSDERAFRRFFKRLSGVSPSEYRLALGEG